MNTSFIVFIPPALYQLLTPFNGDGIASTPFESRLLAGFLSSTRLQIYETA